MKRFCIYCLIACIFFLTACSQSAINDPYPARDKEANTYYASFGERPKTLDPARSYEVTENLFISQIYESPLQYHYLLKPYTLIPQAAQAIPTLSFLDKQGKVLPNNAEKSQIAYSVYTIAIKPGIYYQPHPAFAKDSAGNYYYQQLSATDLWDINKLSDFKHTGTRELTAADYVYEIKRLANPKVQSPIFGLMSEHIVGMAEYAKQLETILASGNFASTPLLNTRTERGPISNFLTSLFPASKETNTFFLDLRNYNFPGVRLIDKYHYQIVLKGQYPQLIYWLAMPFFAPVPWEADRFYSQPGMTDKNITLAWYPVGTGPYMLIENNPNRQLVLAKNPNFHGEYYPTQGMPGDAEKGLLKNAGKPIPFIDKFVFSLEKESIPRWTKFLQGYYDQSGITEDNFSQTIKFSAQGAPELTKVMETKKFRLTTSITPAIFYVGFNMLDQVVGGYSESARKLRQALSIALDFEEYIAIFLNGRGMLAQGPLPPGIFGYEAGKTGLNPYINDWKGNRPQRKSLEVAKRLLAEAGYPNGRNSKTGEPLVLHFDTVSAGNPDEKAYFDWLREQFAEIGVELQIRATMYNRFQEKIMAGDTQIYSWGWVADYPDPEDFFFLLYGPNARVKTGGENITNYANPQFDKLYEQMRILPDGIERQAVIRQMVAILQKDAPWIWGYFPKEYVLSQQWVSKTKPNPMANNRLKYAQIDPLLRAKMRAEWNEPIFWPLGLFVLLLVIVILPVGIKYWRVQHQPKNRRDF